MDNRDRQTNSCQVQVGMVLETEAVMAVAVAVASVERRAKLADLVDMPNHLVHRKMEVVADRNRNCETGVENMVRAVEEEAAAALWAGSGTVHDEDGGLRHK